MCRSVFIIHSFVGEHFGWLHMLAVVNNRAGNLDVLVSGVGTNSLDICLGVLYWVIWQFYFQFWGDVILIFVVVVLLFAAASTG